MDDKEKKNEIEEKWDELLNKELQTQKLYKVLIGVGITLIIVVIITLLVDFWDTYLWFL